MRWEFLDFGPFFLSKYLITSSEFICYFWLSKLMRFVLCECVLIGVNFDIFGRRGSQNNSRWKSQKKRRQCDKLWRVSAQQCHFVISLYILIYLTNIHDWFIHSRFRSTDSNSRPVHSVSRSGIGIIGRDVAAFASTLGEHAGRGLFSSRTFARGDEITFYDGFLVHRDDCPSAYECQDRCINANWVAGIRETHLLMTLALAGRGGGSFANHLCPPNAVFRYHVKGRQGLNYYGLLCSRHYFKDFPPVITLVALRNIAVGEEIFVDYGPGTCNRMGIPVCHPHHLLIYIHSILLSETPEDRC